jgi:hypothetical protein
MATAAGAGKNALLSTNSRSVIAPSNSEHIATRLRRDIESNVRAKPALAAAPALKRASLRYSKLLKELLLHLIPN